jgi:transcriptional regulator with XRE-family HTH domain
VCFYWNIPTSKTMPTSRSDFPKSSHFGEKLRALRLRRKLTLVALARELGYATHAHLSQIETGKRLPNPRLVRSIAQFFGVPPKDLLQNGADLPTPRAPGIGGSDLKPAHGRSKKIEIGLDEALYAQAHQYARTHNVSLSAIIRAWLRRQSDPKALAGTPFGVNRELDIKITKKVEIWVEPVLFDRAQHYARPCPLAPIVRAWLRHHTNPRSPAPLPWQEWGKNRSGRRGRKESKPLMVPLQLAPRPKCDNPH